MKRIEESVKAEKHDGVGETYTWLICTQLHGEGQVPSYSISEDRYHTRFLPELKNKHVSCYYGGLLLLMDASTYNYSILNISTMEKFQLPHAPQIYLSYTSPCVLSSSRMDTSCRIIFFPTAIRGKFISCNLGDTEFIERDFPYDEYVGPTISFNGKLHALTYPSFNLIASDFSDSNLHPQQVVSGESIAHLRHFLCSQPMHLVESCGELLLIVQGIYENEVYDLKIFRADFRNREWMKLETLGDRVVFLDCHYSISSPASACGLKGNAVYWTTHRHLYMYEVEDQSITMKLPFPIAKTFSLLYWVPFPVIYRNEERRCGDSMVQACAVETTKTTELQVEERKTLNKEETKGIVGKDGFWTDISNELLLDIYSRLFAGDKVVFSSVCRSWYSVSSSVNISRLGVPKKCSDDSSPVLVCSNYKLHCPIYGQLQITDFPGIPEGNVRAARYGWLLMQKRYSNTLFFYNPPTKEKITLPDCDQICTYHSLCFSAPPTSADCLVVGGAITWEDCYYICYVRCGDEEWKGREILKDNEPFHFSFCNPVVYKGLYYFLGTGAKLLIYDPKKSKIHFRNAPNILFRVINEGGHQYMLESDDGKLIAVFVSKDGSSVYPCWWSVSNMTWEELDNLGNKMLFTSRPLSFFQRATVRGTSNKIYFPRVVGDNNILFYSLATRRYHTFEPGTSYPNFCGSKFYIKYKGCWFAP